MFSNRYIFIYSSVMVIVVAIALAVTSVLLKPYQDNNIRIEKMQDILASVNIQTTPKNANEMFKKYIKEQFLVNVNGDRLTSGNAFDTDIRLEQKKPANLRQLPVYVCEADNKEKYFIVPLRGRGLWGPIWGYISFKEDLNTVVGTKFDHKSETPGLGAEISIPKFQQQFIGKKIYDSTKFVSVMVIKGGNSATNIHAVDAISGGTITSTGVSNMLHDCLVDYQKFFKNIAK